MTTLIQILHNQNLPYEVALHEPSAFQEEIKQKQREEFQIIGKDCNVYPFSQPNQDDTYSQRRVSKLSENSPPQHTNSISIQGKKRIQDKCKHTLHDASILKPSTEESATSNLHYNREMKKASRSTTKIRTRQNRLRVTTYLRIYVKKFISVN